MQATNSQNNQQAKIKAIPTFTLTVLYGYKTLYSRKKVIRTSTLTGTWLDIVFITPSMLQRGQYESTINLPLAPGNVVATTATQER